MKEKAKIKILNFIGVFFIILGVGAILEAVYNKSFSLIFWLCYMGLILIGIGCLTKNYLLIVSQLNILTIPLVFWNIDFFYFLLTNKTLFGIVDYFFNPGPLISRIISLQHLFTIPLSIYSLYLIKINKNYSLIISFFQIAIIFFITKSTASPEENINCVFKSCINRLEFSYLPYYLFWFVGFFLIILFTNLLIISIPFLRKD